MNEDDDDRRRLLSPTSNSRYGSANIQQEDQSDEQQTNGSSTNIDALFEPRDQIVTYRATSRRWYILTVYWLLSFIQAALWNTFAPITASVEKAYKMTDADISLIENWNNITYTLFIFPFIYLVQRRGLRVPMIVTASLMVAGAFVRCLLYWDQATSLGFINLGQFLIGIAGPVAFFCCTAISATWFPPQQRTLATAVMSVAQSGGVAVSFVIGPGIVQALTPDMNDEVLLRYAVQRLLYAEFVAAALILVVVIIHFPSKPPLPPCESAAQERLGFLRSIKAMCSSVNALMIFTVYAVSAGIFSGWYSLLALAVRNAMGEMEAGWLGCWMTVGGIVVSLIAGFLGDRFPKRMKLQIIVMLAIATACYAWFTLTCGQVGGIAYSSIAAWLTCIVGGSFAAATQPICYELANEVAFPVPEASVTGFLTGLNNFITMIYIFLQMIPQIGTDWLNWSETFSLLLCFPFIFLFRPVYNRLTIDVTDHRHRHQQQFDEDEENSNSNSTNAPAIIV